VFLEATLIDTQEAVIATATGTARVIALNDGGAAV
jgi:hypothetical protein